MTRTSHALVFYGQGRPLEPTEFPTPEPEGSEVLAEVVACTLCGSDLHTIQGRRIEPTPTVLGHEILGRIAAFGPTAPRRDVAGRPLHVGDRVTWAIVASCGECFFCRRSLPQKCERRVKYGHEALAPRRELTGGLAEHVLLAPGSAIVAVPDDLPDAVACPANCATATVAGAIEAAGDLAGRSVLLMGSGMLGVSACAMAASLGASSVIACDLAPSRLARARTFGATHAVLPDAIASCVSAATGGRGVDAAIELTGSPDAFEVMAPLVRTGGTIVLIGATYPARPVPIAMEDVVRRCLTIRGLHNYAPRHLLAAVAFLDAHPEYPFDSLVSAWTSLHHLDDVLAKEFDRDVLRIGVRPGRAGGHQPSRPASRSVGTKPSDRSSEDPPAGGATGPMVPL